MQCLRQIQWPLQRVIFKEETKAKEVETLYNNMTSYPIKTLN